ncbi:hypothetical protein EXIGLDRAFT_835623 [Exidia glandulosa HHB12029]|uniref:UCH repeated domain-containing protein n=1 Tax=Exidia glandulosa HHB12029 TaxID=1314781 RepID=A0A165IL71_EXIGL|nr:hypothetical protein EXIGLDRAFT_835623 [Exidia glandulosa HHB12029]
MSERSLPTTLSDDSALDEYAHWWDRTRHLPRAHAPGMLPPLLAQTLRLAHPAFARVTVDPPTMTQVWGSMEPLHLNPIPLPPDDTDWYKARPHRDAMYVFESHSWVVMSVRSRKALPGVVNLRNREEEKFLGRDAVEERLEVPVCHSSTTDEDGTGTGRPHHFHRFMDAVPFGASHTDTVHDDASSCAWERTRLPRALDLYACCVCSTHVLVSERIPGIIPSELLDKLRAERAAFPKTKAGHSVEDRVVRALETIISIVQNVLWRGITMDIRNNTSNFRERVGHTPTVHAIFETLQFKWESDVLRPPDMRPRSNNGARREIKTFLLRAWVELRAWLGEYRARYGSRVQRPELPPFVITQDATPLIESAIGAAKFQIPRRAPPGEALLQPEDCWIALGLTQDTFSPDLVKHAYFAQLHCDPLRTPFYFMQLQNLRRIAYDESNPTETEPVQRLIYDERVRNRWDANDLHAAVRALGFNYAPGLHQTKYLEDLRIALDVDFFSCLIPNSTNLQFNIVHEEMFESAYKYMMQRTEHDRSIAEEHPDIATVTLRRAELRNSLSTIAEHLGSHRLKVLSLRQGDWEPMGLEEAYTLLHASPEVDDETLVIAHRMQVHEAHREDIPRLREALEVIAHAKRSARLKKYLVSGEFQFADD